MSRRLGLIGMSVALLMGCEQLGLQKKSQETEESPEVVVTEEPVGAPADEPGANPAPDDPPEVIPEATQVPEATPLPEVTPTPEATPAPEVTATPSVGGGDTAPVGSALEVADANPEQEIVITLPYIDSQGDLATACTVDSLQILSVSTPCACSQGVCTVGVRHPVDYAGGLWGDFRYTVSANGKSSEPETVRVLTTCPAPERATGATLTATRSCPNYSGWNGQVASGDLLALQEGAQSEGGYLLAFDADGCFKGRATDKISPWYARGLKVESYANYTDASQNFVNVLMGNLHYLVQPDWAQTISRWRAPFQGQTVAFEGASGSVNPYKVPSDDGNATPDAHLNSIGGNLYFQMGFSVKRKTSDGLVRLVADNANHTMKAYIDGVERSQCALSLQPASDGCPNCAGVATGVSVRTVTDIFLPPDRWDSEVNYAWYEERRVDGMNRTFYGVSRMLLCSTSVSGFADLGHEDKVVEGPFSSSAFSGTALKVDTMPGNTTLDGTIFLGAAYNAGYTKRRFARQENGSYKAMCSHMQGTVFAITQDRYDGTTGFMPNYGDMYTIEKDALGVHIRRYGVSGENAGKLVGTLFTDSLVPANAAAFKKEIDRGLEDTWLVKIPPIPGP